MSLHYSNGSSKKSIGTLAASISSLNKNIKELYYSNGSSKIPIWSGGGKYFIYCHQDNAGLYAFDIKTGRLKQLLSSYITPFMSFKGGFVANTQSYLSFSEYTTEGNLIGTYSIGSLNNENGPIYSPKSDYIFTIRSGSSSIGKFSYGIYTFSTQTLRRSIAAFGLAAILNGDDAINETIGTSSTLREYISNATTDASYMYVGTYSIHGITTLPHDYGVVWYRGYSGSSERYLQGVKKTQTSPIQYAFSNISSGGDSLAYVPFETYILSFYYKGSNYVMDKIDYATETKSLEGISAPTELATGTKVAISKDEFVNITTTTVSVYKSTSSGVTLVSSVTIPSNISFIYNNISDGGYLMDNELY